LIKASQASRWACSELNACSRPFLGGFAGIDCAAQPASAVDECCAANKMRDRIASPENVPRDRALPHRRCSRCLIDLVAKPQLPFSIPNQNALLILACGVVGGALASSKRSGKSTGLFGLPSRSPQYEFATLLIKVRSPSPGATPGSVIMVPNTIWWAASRRHSFSRRCNVRSRPSG
jgi:hypothetical protein